MAEQLDFFKPVQLGMGLVTQPLKHLTEAEADALATVIVRKLGYAPMGQDLDAALQPYHLDNASIELVTDCLPF